MRFDRRRLLRLPLNCRASGFVQSPRVSHSADWYYATFPSSEYDRKVADACVELLTQVKG